jgi:hypothetical protein
MSIWSETWPSLTAANITEKNCQAPLLEIIDSAEYVIIINRRRPGGSFKAAIKRLTKQWHVTVIHHYYWPRLSSNGFAGEVG